MIDYILPCIKNFSLSAAKLALRHFYDIIIITFDSIHAVSDIDLVARIIPF